jgi:ribosome-associated heat shock protein Hsp15
VAGERVRIDKWLWAARFYKTRGLATEAVSGGKVHLNGERTKPARGLQVGDSITVRKESGTWTVLVEGLTEKRGPASQAEALYTETAESRQAREASREERLRAAAGGPPRREPGAGRPTKRERRQLDRWRDDK